MAVRCSSDASHAFSRAPEACLGFSQQGQTINVRAVNARALAQALVSLTGKPLHCPLLRTFLDSLL
jgi:hypothetical protein